MSLWRVLKLAEKTAYIGISGKYVRHYGEIFELLKKLLPVTSRGIISVFGVGWKNGHMVKNCWIFGRDRKPENVALTRGSRRF